MKFNIRQSSDVKQHLSSTLVAKRYFKTKNTRLRELRLARACHVRDSQPKRRGGFTSPRPHSFHRAFIPSRFRRRRTTAAPAPSHDTRRAEDAEDDQGQGEHEARLRHHLCSRRG